jgi:cytochrome c biogenesis protein CcdA
MAGQYYAVPSNGQHDIHLEFQNPPTTTTPSPPPRTFQGLPARRRSKVKLWLGLIGKWFITVIFIIVVYGILIAYALYDVISEKQKKYFNALITGFLIALGLSTMSQLTHAVQDLRWWILSKRPRSRQKVSLEPMVETR